MAKDSRKRALFVFLLIPLIYAFILCFDAASLRSSGAVQLRERQRDTYVGQQQLSKNHGKDVDSSKLQRLLRGKSQEELLQNGIACIAKSKYDMCVTVSPVAVHITKSKTTNVYLTGNQKLPSDRNNVTILPYPQKGDGRAMINTSPVNLLHANAATSLPPCDVNHAVPAAIFSTGGYAGNFFHDISDILIPLFLTSSILRPNISLVLTDYQSWWVQKYQRVLSAISINDIISAPTDYPGGTVHCFPGAIVGLTYHGFMACNKTDVPGNLTCVDFLHFLHSSLFLKTFGPPATVTTQKEKPLMVLLSRRNYRILLNEEEVINLAKDVGFRVEVVTPKEATQLQFIAELVHSSSVLFGVHGAGLTNMIFLQPGAVLLQVVPWGLDWMSTCYSKPPLEMGLKYVGYKIDLAESTLIEKYPIDDPVMVDPESIHMKGYDVSRPIYMEGQNVRLNLTRFRGTLETAMQLAEF
ncbi:Glycosyltransferase family 61 protein [Rhynchospora pubera]|uniref:Glycosyltransferase family 61 protein n=1 Tax=Rhynchospora pubera TaxID=906938 RepID=A0AAV8GQJ0_9POAL|nr:Glycosyltransferase family 61 protein [Rhynchospora pubera]